MLEPNIADEYSRLREDAGAVEFPELTLVELRGEDRLKFLQNFCTNDLKRLSPGGCCEAFICNVKGHVPGHVRIVAGAESLWMVTVAQQAMVLIAHLDRYLIREKVELLDRSTDFRGIFLSGAKMPMCWEACAPHWHSALQVAPDIAPATRLLLIPNDEPPALRNDLSLAGVNTCGFAAWDVLRIEDGFPLYGRDITLEHLPQEVGRDARAISFNKGCYLGQETVARIDALGHVNRVLRGLVFSREAVPDAGSELFVEGKAVAKLTSVVWSPRYQHPLALAYVRRGWESPTTRIEDAEVIDFSTPSN